MHSEAQESTPPFHTADDVPDDGTPRDETEIAASGNNLDEITKEARHIIARHMGNLRHLLR